MRALTLLFLAALLAGCASDDDAGDAPEGATPTLSAPTASPPASGTPTTPTSVSVQHNFTDAPETKTLELARGVYDVSVAFGAMEDSLETCAGIDARIVVKDPDGKVVHDVAATTAIATDAQCGDRVDEKRQLLAGGPWTIEFTGRGPAVGVVSFTV